MFRRVRLRKAECGCDCTHFCYSPLFYDATMLTPLHELLDRQLDRQTDAAAKQVGERFELLHAVVAAGQKLPV